MTSIFILRKFASEYDMYLIAIAWVYVVLLMSLAEATSAQGTVLGALITFALYGALPLTIVLYILGTPAGAAGGRVNPARQQRPCGR